MDDDNIETSCAIIYLHAVHTTARMISLERISIE